LRLYSEDRDEGFHEVGSVQGSKDFWMQNEQQAK
jgi:hypothetical protein